MGIRVATCALLAALAFAAPASADTTPWPPLQGPGQLFVHIGEEHWNDADGLTLLPKVVEDSARYKPDAVTMSGDKDNDGEVAQLEKWRDIMAVYDRAGIPYFPGVGNHDRKAPPGLPGGVAPNGDIANYERVFASRPYPFGDGPPYPGIGPRERPANDPDGASSHYSVDIGNVRWVFMDNSCWGIVNCDPLQSNPFPDAEGNQGQYDFLEKRAKEASADGKLVFVVMHMPTRDPRDQSYADPTSLNHTMGKGSSPDNADFETDAERLGVDGVFVAHIKGQFLYKARGVPYYIDGGAGGELYTTGPVGVDHGYWHGFRLIRVDGKQVTTDSVPIFVPGGITLRGPERVDRGQAVQFEATGMQPVFKDPAKVPALELRDPDPVPRGSSLPGGLASAGRWMGPVALLFLFLWALTREGRPRRRMLRPAFAAGLLGLVSLTAVSFAQQGTPTATPRDSLPAPARIWTTHNPLVLTPVASKDDDPRRDPDTQTDGGGFRGACPGRTEVEITSGWETAKQAVTVPSEDGPIVRSIRRGRRSIRRGRRTPVARLRLAQPAEVVLRVLRGSRELRVLSRRCRGTGSRPLSLTWDGRGVRRGRYRVELRIRSDRRPIVRRFAVRVR